MTNLRHDRIAVIDIGKTNAKVVVVDAKTGAEIALKKIVNTVKHEAPYPHYDTDNLWSFITATLREFAEQPGFDALSITTHGASAALLNDEGELALPVLDYEHLYPQTVNRAYDRLRPDFAESFSPRLPGGLNLGAQLHYQSTCFPDAFAQGTTLLTYPQFWAYRLTGVAANERTSLGCHTDLWLPFRGEYSSLVDKLDIRKRLAPIRSAFDMLGVIRPEVCEHLGLPEPVPVYCGLHDSNASLLPHLVSFGGPCTVVSTGTWVVCFAVGGKPQALDRERDTLVNVDAYGRAVPSSRYMGGREWEMATEGLPAVSPEAEMQAAVDLIGRQAMLLPGLVAGSGPFPASRSIWKGDFASAAERRAAASLYQALMTASCLDIIDAIGPIIVEGPFASNETFLAALQCVSRRPVFAAQGHTGTALGAAYLAGLDLKPGLREVAAEQLDLKNYADHWRAAASE